MTGRIHSIQTLGGADGPGVRCVVFFQGCPLRCLYCHNPDALDFAGGSEMTAEEVVRIVRRDRPYFGKAGGATLSGGEPLAQPAFAAEIFRLCRREGIHTALDTAGCRIDEAVENVLDSTDLVILDIKHTNPEKHRKLTGGELAVTLAFLDRLTQRKLETWVRQVVVPGWTDTAEDICSLAQLLRGRPNVRRVELLPYHALAAEKYRKLGRPCPLGGTGPVDAKQLSRLRRTLKEALVGE